MTQFTEAYDFRGRTLVDRDGEKIGKADEVYSSQEGGRPEWALVHAGLLGSPAAITPAATASCRVNPIRGPIRFGSTAQTWTTMGPRRDAAEPSSGTGAPHPRRPPASPRRHKREE
jgi:hypothetical protein